MDGTDSIRLKAFAKINLTLDITGKRDDGYHYIDTVMQSVDLYDIITLSHRAEPGILLDCTFAAGPMENMVIKDEDNLAWRAAKAFFKSQEMPNAGIHILLEKHIPVAAGLAGGSADAAAVLYGLDLLFDTRCSAAEMTDIGLSVGADVPFCLKGGTMNAEGIGEILTPLTPMPECFFVLCKPDDYTETAKAYAMFDTSSASIIPDTEQVIGALAVGDLRSIADAVCNVFEQVLELPKVDTIKNMMQKYDAMASSMSGSGPTVFGIFEKKSEAERCASALRKQYEEVFVCRPVFRGLEAEWLISEI